MSKELEHFENKYDFKLYNFVTVTRLLTEEELNGLNNKFSTFSIDKIGNDIIKYFIGHKSQIYQFCEDNNYVILNLLEKVTNNCPYMSLKIPFPINVIKHWKEEETNVQTN